MQLEELLILWNIQGLQNDSRKIKPDDAFLAYKGGTHDGRLFIENAIASGAKAIIYDPEDLPVSISLPHHVPCMPIPKLANQLADIACKFYQDNHVLPTITGVTGTNGKTTIAYQLAQAHGLLGEKSAYIGTLGEGSVDNLTLLENTTPDALCLQQLLQKYRETQVKQVCMEVSSHALALGRVTGIPFRLAIFTNLTQDHLDFHKTMDAYANSKSLLFAYPHLQWAIVNKDDPAHALMLKALPSTAHILTYGLESDCDIKVIHSHTDLLGTELQVQTPFGSHSIHIQAFGKFNIYNSLAIFASLLAQGYEPSQVAKMMSLLKAAPGRMEVVAQKPCVIVDYAHTPDALENVLATLTTIKQGKLWVIFGCGGDRDKTKRPLMGKAASKYADQVIITSDNPRGERPESIIEDIQQGIPSSLKVCKMIDRKEAIHYALEQAETTDIILIAGKGHEAYQQIGAFKRPFSDQGIVKEIYAMKSCRA